mgnify:CR=1 FL=1
MTPTDNIESLFGNVIYAYTRADAIADSTILTPHED